MTTKKFVAIALLVALGIPLAGCGLLVPLAVAAVEEAPEIIQDLAAARRSVPPVQPAPAVRSSTVRRDDDVPLIEPDDVSP